MHYIFNGSGFRNWTYSRTELKKLIESAGFTNVKISYAFPNYRTPDIILNDQNFHDHRNFNFNTYSQIIKKYKKKQFVRLGKIAPATKINNNNFYDFTNKKYNELLMCYFIYKCSFAVTGPTGFLDVIRLMRKPLLAINLMSESILSPVPKMQLSS